MRHFAIVIIFGALLQGCGENRNKEVSSTKINSAPMAKAQKTAAVVPAKTPVRKQALHKTKLRSNGHSEMRSDKVTSGRAAPSIPAQKKPLRAMTFNEAQFSDDANDYPSTLEAKKLEKEKYNQ